MAEEEDKKSDEQPQPQVEKDEKPQKKEAQPEEKPEHSEEPQPEEKKDVAPSVEPKDVQKEETTPEPKKTEKEEETPPEPKKTEKEEVTHPEPKEAKKEEVSHPEPKEDADKKPKKLLKKAAPDHEKVGKEEKVKEKPAKEKEEKAKEKIPKKDEKRKVETRKKPAKATPKRDEVKDEYLTLLSPLIFGKYDLTKVNIDDPGLVRYINLHPVGIPHTGARHANRWFGKTKINIVERLINNMMRTEHTTGKKAFAYRTVRNAFEIIEKRTKQNPVQVLVHALQNTSPKEEITRLRFGGISVPKAVDTSSARRLDFALRNICKGAVSASHKNKKRMEVCLAEELILASKADMNSFAISKKEEIERIAASAR